MGAEEKNSSYKYRTEYTGPLIPLFWTSGDICPGLKVRVDPFLVWNGFLSFISGVTPADLLMASMAVEPF